MERQTALIREDQAEFLDENEVINFSGLCRQALDVCMEAHSWVDADGIESAVLETESGEKITIEFSGNSINDVQRQDSGDRIVDQ